jgi:sepiapterin reductase
MSFLIVITGGSKGLGAAIARQTAEPGTTQILVARSAEALEQVAQHCQGLGAATQGVVADLSCSAGRAQFEESLQAVDWASLDRALLVNNASQVTPIKALMELDEAEVEQAVQLNFISTLILTSTFMRHVSRWPDIQADVLNVSSGVSLNPLPSWSVYCATKAAVNTVTRLTSEETRSWKTPMRSVAVNPGPLDTEMQAVIRRSRDSDFPDVERFRNLQRDRKLIDPELAARRALSLFDKLPFPNGQFVDLKDG